MRLDGRTGVRMHQNLSLGRNAMKVDHKTVKFILDLVAALAIALSDVVDNHYSDIDRG